ncbi:MAG: hypothetical protein AAGK74_01555, partial [Chloroflexota bacterium]
MSNINAQFITPPSEEEVVYPYRRVWISLIIEAGLLFVICFAFLFSSAFVTIPETLWLPVGVLLSLMPLGLWVVFSWGRERLAIEPRKRLFPVVVLSALAANAVGYPLVFVWLDVDSW